MASLIPGYEYDVFISYRHKDNKYDHWVTDFVTNLRKELEATFKDEINLFFDKNQKDGLLPIHDVDKTVYDKLRCLIFIPIISHTYCDPSSYALAIEFRTFVQLASNDEFGLKIKLPNGNYVSRLLPVQIHDLSEEEKLQCEKILNSRLRGIDFIYSEPGVNRPLRPAEENPLENMNHTIYRNQINKVANAIREIIDAIRNPESTRIKVLNEESHTGEVKSKNLKLKILAGCVFVIIFLSLGLLLKGRSGTREHIEKSIAVLPFKNLGRDNDNEYFGEGMSQEILDNLFMIDSLKIPTASTSFGFKETQLTDQQIARKLNVVYLLEGDFKFSGNKVRISARLINTDKDRIVWSDKFERDQSIADYIDIQSEVAQKVAEKLQVVLDLSVLNRMSSEPTQNIRAYNLYLKAISEPHSFNSMKLLEEAISIDSTFAPAYPELAFYYIFSGGHLAIRSREEVLENAVPLIKKALILDNDLLSAHTANAYLRLYYYQDFKAVAEEYDIVKKLGPSNSEAISWFSDYLLATGKFKEALKLGEETFSHNQTVSSSWENLALSYYFDNQEEKAVKTIYEASALFAQDYHIILNVVRILNYTGRYNEIIDLYKQKYDKNDPNHNISWLKGHIGIAAYKTGDTELARNCLDELLNRSSKSPNGSPSFFAAAIYTAMNDYDRAIQMLEKSYETREVELYWLGVEPLFSKLRNDPRFLRIIEGLGFTAYLK